MGDHVKVMKGHYEGDTGLIVRVEDQVVVLFSDLSMHEVRTFPQFKLYQFLVIVPAVQKVLLRLVPVDSSAARLPAAVRGDGNRRRLDGPVFVRRHGANRVSTHFPPTNFNASFHMWHDHI